MSHLYIFTLTWNAVDKLSKLKESLLPALQEIDYTWLIKDNASKDNTVEVASAWGDNIKVLPYKDNRQNFSEGMNYCFNAATPKDNDLVLLLNNDVIFNDTKSLKHMIQIMTHNPEVGVVGSRLLYNNTNKLQHAGVIFDSHMRMPSHFRLNEISDASAEKNREFQVVTGAVLLTTGENYKNICTTNASSNKGMDEKYHWAFDDVDLCLSIKYNLNKKIVYCGQTNIFHEESATLKKNPVNKLFMSHNANYLRDKWKGRYLADKELYYSNINQGLFQSK